MLCINDGYISCIDSPDHIKLLGVDRMGCDDMHRTMPTYHCIDITFCTIYGEIGIISLAYFFWHRFFCIFSSLNTFSLIYTSLLDSLQSRGKHFFSPLAFFVALAFFDFPRTSVDTFGRPLCPSQDIPILRTRFSSSFTNTLFKLLFQHKCIKIRKIVENDIACTA